VTNSQGREWYLHDQGWRVLTASGDPLGYLRPEDLRPGRRTDSPEQQQRDRCWQLVERDDVVLNRGVLRNDLGEPLDFRRLVLVGDAGSGKSKALGWIDYRLQSQRVLDPRCHAELVVRLEIRVFARNWATYAATLTPLERLTLLVLEYFRPDLERAAAQSGVGTGEREREQQRDWVRSVIRRGQLCLILDGLDQVSDVELDPVVTVLSSTECGLGRFILAGRPNVVTSERGRKLDFAGGRWSWVHVQDLTRSQQVRYLGWLPDGRLRFEAITPEARDLLVVPRVLYYLRGRVAEDLRGLRTASAVYAGALDYMLREALRRTDGGVERVQTRQVEGLLGLLALAAWECMLAFQGSTGGSLQPLSENEPGRITQYRQLPARPEQPPENYQYNVQPEHGFERLLGRLKQRYEQAGLYGKFDEQWQVLERLNAGVLDAGLFDDHQLTLNQIVWSNRSIHEFCLARYFAQWADRQECLRLWDWIYIRTEPQSDQYYQFWQFLCEMPADRRDPVTWLRSIELLFWPTIADPDAKDNRPTRKKRGNPAGRYYARRSNEMIYRAWAGLRDYCSSPQSDVRKLAERILECWRGEFAGAFAAGAFGAAQKRTAAQLKGDFLTIEQRPFRMGTRDENVLPDWVEQRVREKFELYRQEPQRLTDEVFSNWTSRGAQRERERVEPLVRRALRDNRFLDFVRELYRLGNDYEVWCERTGPFQTARRSVTNAWYRLYDSTWGFPQRQSWYQQYSAGSQHPAIDLNFFDSWVFSQWLYWDGVSCRLLWEDEWEYCAKLGLGADEWYWDFWFGEHFDVERDRGLLVCAETSGASAGGEGCVQEASELRASPGSKALDPLGLGLMDFQGNHWVWCQDAYRAVELREDLFGESGRQGWGGREESDAGQNVFVGRVLRGGSFRIGAIYARCSFRLDSGPSDSHHDHGCRLARAAIRKP
jgi:formylglycine-generating enzyme required for sulfatase activity